MTHPYENLPKSAFWRGGVAGRKTRAVEDLWRPKNRLKAGDIVASYGSCFAQHIGRALGANGMIWQQSEPAPHGMKEATRHAFGYDLFSSRTGNIYTTSMLRNWCRWALLGDEMPSEIWEGDEGLIDPIRPALEPTGFQDRAELTAARGHSLAAFRKSVIASDVLVFTLGLTERWVNRDTGAEYQICPGTLAGAFDPAVHQFDNMGFLSVHAALDEALGMMRAANPKLKFILTVSPVPLTATASGAHVLPATTYSKSVLRAVAGEMAMRHDDLDYFPSYELITAPTMRGSFYAQNQRSVTEQGVRFVMQHFFQTVDGTQVHVQKPEREKTVDLVCEEELLDAFGADP